MGKKKEKYLMGRLNLIAAYDDKFDYLAESLKSNVLVDSVKKIYKFGVFNYREVEYENEKFIVGTLVKFTPVENEEKVNIEEGTIDINKDENNVSAKSNFTLHVNSGLIAFKPDGNKISEIAFRRHLAEIIKKANEGLFVEADIQIISEEHDIFLSLTNFDKIHKVNISLHPSNPTNRDIWKKLDEELQSANVENYHSHYKSEKGLKVDESSKIYSEISMAADGYGKATIKGVQDKQEKVASTDKVPVKFEVLEDDKKKSINKDILNKFKEIWRRMKN